MGSIGVGSWPPWLSTRRYDMPGKMAKEYGGGFEKFAKKKAKKKAVKKAAKKAKKKGR